MIIVTYGGERNRSYVYETINANTIHKHDRTRTMKLRASDPKRELLPLKKLVHADLLSPEQLSSMTTLAAQEMTLEGESSNTVASYASATRYWGAWFALRYGTQLHLPVGHKVVIQFIVDHLPRRKPHRGDLVHELPPEIDDVLVAHGFKGKKGPLALATVKHRVSVLAQAHVHSRLANPCEDPSVRALLRATTKAHASRGDVAKKQPALTLDPLQKILDTCDDSMIGKRDRALILFAWASGGRRRSEVAGASGADMKFLSRNAEGFDYHLLRSKNNQAGEDRADSHKPIMDDAASALEDWLQASGISEGKIFRRIYKNGRLGPSLQAAAVRDIVRSRSLAAGFTKDPFSAHSLRSGFMTEGGRQEVPLQELMAMSTHKSVKIAMGYTQQGQMATSKAAHLLDAAKKTKAD
jgi:site-specific recombinase XerC